MKKLLTILLLVTAGQLPAQTNPITAINITLPSNPDATVANWGTGTTAFTIVGVTRFANGRIDPHVEESRILVIIKKNGAKICGSFNSNNAPKADFKTERKVWSGTNAVELLGKGCTLPPGNYELSVQFFGNRDGKIVALCDEQTKSFTIKGKDQEKTSLPATDLPVRKKPKQ